MGTFVDQFLNKIATEIAIDVTQLFDASFETKSFGGNQWKPRQIDLKGTLMNNTGTLRRSIKYQVNGSSVRWISNLPYANTHNQGEKIKITRKMHRFFWAKYYELAGKIKKKKNGEAMKSSLGVAKVANYYKALACKKIGSTITIPQRQFIGDNPQVKAHVKKIIDRNMQKLNEAFARRLNNKK